jgi:hypothetical protein
MPGQLWNTFRQGNRTEYLATYLLSALGIAVKVPREEDVGIDFHCNLASDFGDGLLKFFAPYNVQIKSAEGGGEKIKYGGIKDGKFKDHEVRWLLSQRIPFFIGVVDKKAGVIRIYSTATRWFAKYHGKIPCEIVFVADTPDSQTHLGSGTRTDIDPSKIPGSPASIPPNVELVSWEIPLGQPALVLNSEQAEDPCHLLNVRNYFKDFIYLDEKNGVFRGMGLQAFYWPLLIVPNRTLMRWGISVSWGNRIDHNVGQQMTVLAPLVASLQRTYVEAGDTASAHHFDGLLNVIPDTDEFSLMRQIILDSISMMESKEAQANPTESDATSDPTPTSESNTPQQ